MRLRAVLLLPLTVALLLLGAPMATSVAYPVTTCATIAVSTTHPLPGESISVTGQGFDPHATVRLVLDTGDQLATVKTSGDGTFSTKVTLPKISGRHELHARGGTTRQSSGCPADPVVSLSLQGGSSEAAGGPGGNGGGTAFTGVDVLALLAIAAALIAAGVALNRRSRTGRRTADSTVS